MKNTSVAILHGWSGGNWHTQQFVKELEAAGFKQTSKTQDAEVVIAHSAGCYNIPTLSASSLVVLIGVPYWPGQSILTRLVRKNTAGAKFAIKKFGYSYALKKGLWCTFYVFAKPNITILALRNYKSLDFLKQMKNQHILLIRNHMDIFCSPEIEKTADTYKNIKFVQLPGGHDDFYTNPAPYVDLVLKEL